MADVGNWLDRRGCMAVGVSVSVEGLFGPEDDGGVAAAPVRVAFASGAGLGVLHGQKGRINCM